MFVLRPYQEECIQKVKENFEKGVRSQLLVLATGLGKAQPINTPIVTDEGWKFIGDINPGDQVYSSDGVSCRVIGVFPQGVKHTYRVTFSDGTSTICCKEHLWQVQTKSQKSRGSGYKVKTTEELLDDIRDGSGAAKWFIPVTAPVEFSMKELPISPYLLGAIIGDGGIAHSLMFSNTDVEILDRVSSEATQYGCHLTKIPTSDCDYRFNSDHQHSPLKKLLVELGLFGKKSYHKFIPDIYLRGSVLQRLDLLRGLMDTDGSIQKDGNCEFTTTSLKLFNNVTELVQSLGGVPRFRMKHTPSTYGRSYRMTVNIPLNPFYISRKASQWNPIPKQGRTRSIKSILPYLPLESVCIKVDRADGLYLTNDFIVTHNTVIFAHLPSYIKQGKKKTLVLAHREELLSQAEEKIRAVDNTLNISIEQGARHADPDSDVIIASVATLGRSASDRIERFKPDDIGLIIIDEAHHATAGTYRNILDYFKDAFVLGVTATPDRADNVGLEEIFQTIAYKYDIRDGVNDNYLSRIRAFTVRTDTDLSDVKVQMGDFQQGVLAQMVNNPLRNQLVVQTYMKRWGGLKALVFAVDVQHATDLTKAFCDAGVKAGFIIGSTATEERKTMLKDFRSGKLSVLVNCAVLTEGFDEPSIEVVLMARPTASKGLFIQMVGRGTRLHEGKKGLILVDFVDNTSKHNLVTASSLVGLDTPLLKLDGHDIIALQEDIDELIGNNPYIDFNAVDLDNIKAIVDEVSILALMELPKEIDSISNLCWLRCGKGYKLSMGSDEAPDGTIFRKYAEIQPDALGHYTCDIYYLVKHANPSNKNSYSKFTKSNIHNIQRPTLKECIRAVDFYIADKFSKSLPLIRKDSPWMFAQASEKQVKMLKDYGIKSVDFSKITKGQASRIMGHIFNNNTHQKTNQVRKKHGTYNKKKK